MDMRISVKETFLATSDLSGLVLICCTLQLNKFLHNKLTVASGERELVIEPGIEAAQYQEWDVYGEPEWERVSSLLGVVREGDDPGGDVWSPGGEESQGSDQEVAGPLGGALDTDNQHHLISLSRSEGRRGQSVGDNNCKYG